MLQSRPLFLSRPFLKTPAKVLLALALGAVVCSPDPRAEDLATTEEPENEAKPGDAEEKPAASGIVENVVVSATRAEERRDPATFSDLDGEEIAARNRGQDLAMILGDTPNAYAYSDAGNGVGYSYLSLRGFDQRRIAVNINGIPLNTPETHQVYFIDLADFAGNLDRVQVQRGTGTALYGSPAVGGVVDLETGSLSTVEGGEFRLGAGSFGTFRAALRYGGPLAGGRWAWSARVSHVESDGYRIPSWTRHTLGFFALERFGVDSVLRINLFGGPEKTQLAFLGVPAPYLRGEITGDPDLDRRYNPLHPGETDTFFQPHLQVLHDWRIGDGLFLKNTGYVISGRGFFRQFSDSYDFVETYDEQGMPQEISPILDAWQRRWIGELEIGWIPRLSWEHRGGALIVGLETLLHDGHHEGTVQEGLRCVSPDPADPCQQTEVLSDPLTNYDYRNKKTSLSLFVRETLRPSPRLHASLELQATHHRFAMRDDAIRGLSFDGTYSFLTPRAGLNWNVSARWNLYGSVSTARSEPAFRDIWDPENPFAPPSSVFGSYDPVANRYSDPLARPEQLRDYELGIGYQGHTTRFKANVYRMDFRDELVFAGGIDSDGLPITDNAGRSTHQGIEVDVSSRLPGDIDITGYLALSRDVLNEYTLVFGPNPGDVVDDSGNRIALFPDHQARVRLARRFGSVRVVLGARRIGTIYLDNSENERLDPAARDAPGYVDKKIDPYTLFDLQAYWDLDRVLTRPDSSLSLDLQVENLLDKRYVAFGYAFGQPEFIPGATRNIFVGITYGF